MVVCRAYRAWGWGLGRGGSWAARGARELSAGVDVLCVSMGWWLHTCALDI